MEPTLLAAARDGDPVAFERLAAPYRSELVAHCYRMLGSVYDAEDAAQEALLVAWRGIARFDGSGPVRTWLYRVATHAALRLVERRPTRLMADDMGPAWRETADLGGPIGGPVWIEPWPEPAGSTMRRDGVELPFVAALQHLPGRERAALILRDVLAFGVEDTAAILAIAPGDVDSVVELAREAIDARMPPVSQRAEMAALGEDGRRELVDAFVGAWQKRDADALVELLTEDARFAMPPLPAWFDGRADVRRFLVERVFATPWRLEPTGANGQLAFRCFQDGELGAVNVLTLRDGRVSMITGFLDPSWHALFD